MKDVVVHCGKFNLRPALDRRLHRFGPVRSGHTQRPFPLLRGQYSFGCHFLSLFTAKELLFIPFSTLFHSLGVYYVCTRSLFWHFQCYTPFFGGSSEADTHFCSHFASSEIGANKSRHLPLIFVNRITVDSIPLTRFFFISERRTFFLVTYSIQVENRFGFIENLFFSFCCFFLQLLVE